MRILRIAQTGREKIFTTNISCYIYNFYFPVVNNFQEIRNHICHPLCWRKASFYFCSVVKTKCQYEVVFFLSGRKKSSRTPKLSSRERSSSRTLRSEEEKKIEKSSKSVREDSPPKASSRAKQDDDMDMDTSTTPWGFLINFKIEYIFYFFQYSYSLSFFLSCFLREKLKPLESFLIITLHVKFGSLKLGQMDIK